MTAQVAVLNRHGLALCTDSAVTVPGLKGQDSVNNNGRKLFCVDEAIGVMNYNAMAYCDVTIEDLLNWFRKGTKRRVAAKVADCSEGFFKFLERFKIPPNLMSDFAFDRLVYDVVDKFDEESENLEMKFSDLLKQVKSETLLFDIPESKFTKKHRRFLQTTLDGRFECFRKNPKAEILNVFCELCRQAASRSWSSSSFSGIVFAGYGKRQVFPSLEHWVLDGHYNGKPRYWKVNDIDLNKERQARACVASFGQTDISNLILTGVDQTALDGIDIFHDIKNTTARFLMHGISEIFKSDCKKDGVKEDVEKLISVHQNHMESAIRDLLRYSIYEDYDSFFDRIAMLEKTELAEIGSALVKATSVRRMIDEDLRTVGGLVNASVITKSDGFVWLGKKHYVKPSINPNFKKYLRK